MEYQDKEVDPYKLLGFSQDVIDVITEEELKTNYKKMMKNCDRNAHRYTNEQYTTALKLLNKAKEIILKDINQRKVDTMDKILDKNNNEVDLDILKEAIITRIKVCIDSYKEAKEICDFNKDLDIMEFLSKLFAEIITAANNCIFLIDAAKTREDARQVMRVFNEKEAKFNKNIFEEIPKLMFKSLLFIYNSAESQFVLKTIEDGLFKMTAREWFEKNHDALVTVLRFDRDLITKFEEIEKEYSEDELQPFLDAKFKAVARMVVNTINTRLSSTKESYHNLEGDFLEKLQEKYRKTIQEQVDKYRREIERRKQKIEHLKFAFDIGEDVENDLKEKIHDEESFNEMYDSIAKQLYSNKAVIVKGAYK